MSDDPEGLVTLAEAARRLRRDPEGLRALIRRGKLTAKRGNDGRLLVRLADLPAERSTGLAATAEGRPADLPAGLPDRVEAELWDRLVHPEDAQWVGAECERTNQTGEPFSGEYRMGTADGQVRWVRDEAVLVHAADGRTVFWQGILTDITASHTAADRLAAR